MVERSGARSKALASRDQMSIKFVQVSYIRTSLVYEMFVSCIVDEVRNQVLLGHSSMAPSEIRALLYIASVLEYHRPRARFDRESPSARSLLCCSCAFATTTLQSFLLEDSRLKPTTNLRNGCSTYLCENTAWTSGKFANGHNAAVDQAI